MKDDRTRLLADISDEVRLTRDWLGKDALDARVMAAMAGIDRGLFVPADYAGRAYDNGPVAIGYGQTVSQPYIVALMSDLLTTRPAHRVLEIGTGSGYQAAILAQLVKQVYTIEIIPELAAAAARRLNHLGYANVAVRVADGYEGWADAAPFDGIIVTAAASQLPAPLVAQLRPGGRLVIPIGPAHASQMLMVIRKTVDGTLERREVLPVVFVPFTGQQGQERGEGS